MLQDVLENAKVFSSIEEAVKDSSNNFMQHRLEREPLNGHWHAAKTDAAQ